MSRGGGNKKLIKIKKIMIIMSVVCVEGVCVVQLQL